MVSMTVSEMIEATGATLVAGSSGATFAGVDIDSRRVPEGGAFVAFAGERVDGNRFAAAALESGARVVVLTAEPDETTLGAAALAGGVLVRAADDDGEEFLLRLARAWRGRNPQWTVVGVTGSVGKTTTKDMLAAAIGAQRRVHATKGNYNNLIGVPLTVLGAPSDAQVLVVEMGMNMPGEMERLSAAACPDVAVVTNVGTSHIGNLGSREGIARAKAGIMSGMRHDGPHGPALVLSDADDFSALIAREYCEPEGVRVVRVGHGDGCVVSARDVALDDDGRPVVTLRFGDGLELRGRLPLPGRAMVLDLLSAMGIVQVLGLDRQGAFEAICAMRPTRMRLEVLGAPGTARIIDDSYNASPSSMAAALDVLCSMRCEGRRIAVLGEIGELGEASHELHTMVGAYAAAKPLDLLVLVGGSGADAMAHAALTMGWSADRLERFANAQEAARVMVPVFAEGDLVLAKGSRSVGLDLIAKEVLAS